MKNHSPTNLSEVAIRLDEADTVAIAKQDLPSGLLLELPSGQAMTVQQPIPYGHKIALKPVQAGESLLRYGQVIGFASRDIQPGEWVHSHNLQVGGMQRQFSIQVAGPPKPDAGLPTPTFMGYKRADGRVGTRNYLAVISTVSCSAQTARLIAEHFSPERLAPYPNLDGVIAVTHSTGCGAPPGSLPFVFLQRTLLNLAVHPNVAGAIFVSLGCEGNQIQECGRFMAEFPELPGPLLSIQELGGIQPTVRVGIAAIEARLEAANASVRTPQPLSELAVALQCGGSDGWSGVTANPLVGRVADAIVQAGGTVVLAETPEIYGAEQLLTRRVAAPEVGEALIERIRWWQEHAEREGFSLDNNPSPGNKAGGLTTIYEKSLGAIAKGGSTPLQAVYSYAERVEHRGLVFMDSPGNDPISVTGQVAGGCNLVLFTTGRGSVFGGNFAPCLKIASNSALFRRMEGDMDFNAGVLLEGSGFETSSKELLKMVIETASGQKTKSECQGAREGEFIPWQPGGIL